MQRLCNNEDMNISELMVRIESEQRLNDNQLARVTGIDPTLVWRLRKGQRKPGRDTIVKIGRVYPQYLLPLWEAIK